MLVRDGRVQRPERHLARLAASVHALYRAELGPDLGARVAGAAAGHALARLRVEVVPRSGEGPAVSPSDSGAALAAPDAGSAEEATVVTVGVAGGTARTS